MLYQGTTEQLQVRMTSSGSPVTDIDPEDTRVTIVKPSGASVQFPRLLEEVDSFEAPGVYELTLTPQDLDEEGGFAVLLRPRDVWSPAELNYATLRGLDFSTSSDGWTVGDGGVILQTTDGGSTWVPQNSDTTNDLFGVDVVGGSEVYAVGIEETLVSYDGSTWSALWQAGTRTWHDVDAEDPSDVVIVEDSGVVKRYDGSTVQTLDNTTSSETLWGIERPAPTSFVAVGASGTVIRSTDDGTNWSLVSTPTTDDLFDVTFPTGSDGWAVGSAGTVLYTSDGGASWTTQTTPHDATLRCVEFVDATTGFVGGDDGTVLKTTDGGSTWDRQSSAQPNPLRGVHTSGTSSALFVGGDDETVVVDGESSPSPGFDDVYVSFDVGDPLDEKVKRLLGLNQENYRVTDQTYDEHNNLAEAKISIYENASDTVDMVNPLAEYQIKASHDAESRLQDYLVTKL